MLYSKELEDRVRNWALEHIPANRQAHVQGVVDMVDKLARHYAPDHIELVRLAGWIHDSAKAYSDAELLEMAETYGVAVTPFERQVPMLLHGVVAYHMANSVFGLDDPALRTACHYHTTGAPGMNITDKIVMLGDAIEENTRTYDGVDELRRVALDDLDQAVKMLVERTVTYLMARDRLIDPRVVNLWNELVSE